MAEACEIGAALEPMAVTTGSLRKAAVLHMYGGHEGAPASMMCPACGQGRLSARRHRVICIGSENKRACGFTAGTLSWVMAGALGETFNTPDKARAHIAALFEAVGWRPVWEGADG
jgi:hypothetical protein